MRILLCQPLTILIDPDLVAWLKQQAGERGYLTADQRQLARSDAAKGHCTRRECRSSWVGTNGQVDFWPDLISILEGGRIAWNAVPCSPAPRLPQVSDVYLLALAVQQGGRLVTLDRVFPLPAVPDARTRHFVVIHLPRQGQSDSEDASSWPEAIWCRGGRAGQWWRRLACASATAWGNALSRRLSRMGLGSVDGLC